MDYNYITTGTIHGCKTIATIDNIEESHFELEEEIETIIINSGEIK